MILLVLRKPCNPAGLWRTSLVSEWFFRGQADAEWGLMPTAFRAASWRAFGSRATSFNDDLFVAREERALLHEFANGLYRAGLTIPGARLQELAPLAMGLKLQRDWRRSSRSV